MEAIWIAIIGVLGSTVTGVISFIVGRKKANAEAGLINVEMLKQQQQFYSESQKGNNKTIQEYIAVSNENRQQILELQHKQMQLVALVYKILKHMNMDMEQKEIYIQDVIRIVGSENIAI